MFSTPMWVEPDNLGLVFRSTAGGSGLDVECDVVGTAELGGWSPVDDEAVALLMIRWE